MPGIYVHIPFCRSKCGYCDFHSVARLSLADDYLAALEGEWQQRRSELDGKIKTVYIGGGTPSALTVTQLSRLLAMLPVADAGEITIEVNPEDVTPDFAAFLAASPINRVSMGVQSLVDTELLTASRRHTAARAIEAYASLRAAGIANISLDLIYGLPGQTVQSWQQSLASLLELRPDHLSAYLLSFEPLTRFTRMRDAGEISEADEDTAVAMYDALIAATHRAGMEHYEISNFAMPGRRSRHNSAYWDGTDYLGLGTGAHSCISGVRSFNPPDIRRYIAASGRNFAVIDSETAENRFNDMLITRLRTSAGLSIADARSLFGSELTDAMLRDAAPHIASGAMTLGGDTLRISEKSWIVSDRILVDLLAVSQ